jgi:type II secretory pathway predicted ATPase ExeA
MSTPLGDDCLGEFTGHFRRAAEMLQFNSETASSGADMALDRLQYLLAFTPYMLLVCGTSGAGKSSLAGRLKQMARPSDQVILVRARPGMDAGVLFSRLLDQSEQVINDASVLSAGVLLDKLSKKYSNFQSLHLVVDDAQSMTEDATQLLLDLAGMAKSHGVNLHLVLFSTPEFTRQMACLEAPSGGVRIANMALSDGMLGDSHELCLQSALQPGGRKGSPGNVRLWLSSG